MGVIIPYSAWIQDFDTVLGGHKIPAGVSFAFIIFNSSCLFMR